MISNTIGFIGAGRVARILLAGWQQAGLQLSSVIAADVDAAALDCLRKLNNRVELVVSDVSLAARQDVVFIAVHPPVIPQLLPTLQPLLKESALVVSLAPKFTIAQLSTLLDGFDRIARVIPNVPSLVGHGYNPVALGSALDSQNRAALAELFTPLGEFPEVPEQLLEVYAVITAMGPTYFWPQCDELMYLAEDFGLTKTAALEAVSQMLAGTAAALAKSNLTATELQGLVPVQPLCESEASIREAYRTKLPGLLAKIRPTTT